jgi:Tol biopolymer transport system component
VPAWQFTTAQTSRSPQWSPDGRTLAFLSARADADAPASAPPPKTQVYLLRVDAGGEARKLTSLNDGVDAFAWSPDGTRIACTGKTSPGHDPAVPATDLRGGAERHGRARLVPGRPGDCVRRSAAGH